MLRMIIVVAGAFMLLGTVALAVDNRRSPQIYTFVSAMVGGVALSLVVLYGAFRDEHVSDVVSTSLLIDGSSGTPPPLPFDDLMRELPHFDALINRLEQLNVFVTEFQTRGHQIPWHTESGRRLADSTGRLRDGESLYEELLLLQIVLVLQQRFEFAWDWVEGTEASILGRSERRAGGGGGRYPSVTLTRDALQKRLSTNRFSSLTVGEDDLPDITSPAGYPAYRKVDMRVLRGLALPPRSTLEIADRDGLGGALVIANPFVRLTVKWIGSEFSELGEDYTPLLTGLGLQPRPERPRWHGVTFHMGIDYVMSGTKHGHPDVVVYRKWASDVVAMLKRAFDDHEFWRKLSEGIQAI